MSQRIIKFRAWDKENKGGMLHFDLDGLQKSHYSLVVKGEFVSGYGGGSALYDLSKYELMQFTGLKDKNGKEIYEGDITGDWEIYWDEDEVSFRLKDIYPHSVYGRETHDMFAFTSPFEVIGNIYENPDLLKQN